MALAAATMVARPVEAPAAASGAGYGSLALYAGAVRPALPLVAMPPVVDRVCRSAPKGRYGSAICGMATPRLEAVTRAETWAGRGAGSTFQVVVGNAAYVLGVGAVADAARMVDDPEAETPGRARLLMAGSLDHGRLRVRTYLFGAAGGYLAGTYAAFVDDGGVVSYAAVKPRSFSSFGVRRLLHTAVRDAVALEARQTASVAGRAAASRACRVTPDPKSRRGVPASAKRILGVDARHLYGKGAVWVMLPVFGFQAADAAGSFFTKLAWYNDSEHPLRVSGRRLDGRGRFSISIGSGRPVGGMQPSIITVTSLGCWRLTARAGGGSMHFTLRARRLRLERPVKRARPRPATRTSGSTTNVLRAPAGFDPVAAPRSVRGQCAKTARMLGYPVFCPRVIPDGVVADSSCPGSPLVSVVCGAGSRAWRGWSIGSGAVGPRRLVMTSSPRVLSYARLVNGPAWYPAARVIVGKTVTVNGRTMRWIRVPAATNDGSGFSEGIALTWNEAGHSYAVGFAGSTRRYTPSRSWTLFFAEHLARIPRVEPARDPACRTQSR